MKKRNIDPKESSNIIQIKTLIECIDVRLYTK